MDKLTFDNFVSEGKLVYSHTSIARDYLCVNGRCYKDYCGIYGRGVVEHIPTLRSNIRGNSHHFIRYYLYV